MIDIFNELYKKVLGFFQHQEKTESASKDVACNRLKLVLMQDRTNLTPRLLERMRGEMINLLSKYVEMDKEALELNFAQEGDSMALMLSIPVLRAKDEEEIQAILDAEDAEDTEDTDADADFEEEEKSETEKQVSDEEISEDIQNDEAAETLTEKSEAETDDSSANDKDSEVADIEKEDKDKDEEISEPKKK